MKATNKNVKIIICDNADEKKTLGESYEKYSKEIKYKIYVTRNSIAKWRGRTGICYNLLLDTIDDGTHNTA